MMRLKRDQIRDPKAAKVRMLQHGDSGAHLFPRLLLERLAGIACRFSDVVH
jgi:hypothetical protein